MTESQEFVRIIFIQKTNVSSNGEINYSFEKKYVDITLDLSMVTAYSHYVNLANGDIDNNVTEVYLQGLAQPIYIKMAYYLFNDIIQAL
jgi:hypothetical protein